MNSLKLLIELLKRIIELLWPKKSGTAEVIKAKDAIQAAMDKEKETGRPQ